MSRNFMRNKFGCHLQDQGRIEGLYIPNVTFFIFLFFYCIFRTRLKPSPEVDRLSKKFDCCIQGQGLLGLSAVWNGRHLQTSPCVMSRTCPPFVTAALWKTISQQYSGFVQRVWWPPFAKQQYWIPWVRQLRSSAGGSAELMHNVWCVICNELASHALFIPCDPVRVDRIADVCQIYCHFFQFSSPPLASRE